MEILKTILIADEQLFLLINNLPHSFFLDQFFLFFSFYPVIIWITLGIIGTVLEEKRDKIFFIRLIVALILSGSIASGLIKPIIKRPRPDLIYGRSVVVVMEKPALIPWNNDFAFPSGHAAVAFAGAYILIREELNRKPTVNRNRTTFFVGLLWTIAGLTAFSRIYLGKHYPLDIVTGGILGWFIAILTWKLVDLFHPPKAS